MLKQHLCKRIRGGLVGEPAVVGQHICDGAAVLYHHEPQAEQPESNDQQDKRPHSICQQLHRDLYHGKLSGFAETDKLLQQLHELTEDCKGRSKPTADKLKAKVPLNRSVLNPFCKFSGCWLHDVYFLDHA